MVTEGTPIDKQRENMNKSYNNMVSWLNQFTDLDPDVTDAITNVNDLYEDMINHFDDGCFVEHPKHHSLLIPHLSQKQSLLVV